jgi:4-oxalocrotonate tautomerase
MPTIQIDMIEGRTIEQKRAMVKKVTEAVVESIACPPEAVHIIVRENPKALLAQAGKLLSDK